MTNVPDEIRTALADAYRLFDVTYATEGTDHDWAEYWGKANAMIQEYGDDIPLLNLFVGYASLLQAVFNARKPKNETLTWDKDEDYPHPRKD